MSADPLLEHATPAAEEPQTVGYTLVCCGVCGDAVPVGVEVWIAWDDDGDRVLSTEPNITDLEAHMAAHELAGEGVDE